MTVFNFGSINIDHVYRVSHLVKPGETLSSSSLQTVLGGKGANQSVALARAGIPVHHIGRLGTADAWAAEQLRQSGVDTGHVDMLDESSGHAIIQVDDEGENSIILHGGANQGFDREVLDRHLSNAARGDWLLMQNECNDNASAFAIAAEAGVSIAFNPAPMTQSVMQLPLNNCELLILNETEAQMLSGSEDMEVARRKLASLYPDTRLVLTLGSRGATAMYQGCEYSHPAIPVEVVDTTGAGDTFVGYFLAALINGLDEQEALRRACHAAALAVSVAGATPSIPASATVDQFIR